MHQLLISCKNKKCLTQNDSINMKYTSGSEGFLRILMLSSKSKVKFGFNIGEDKN